jgi:ribosomal protein L44E
MKTCPICKIAKPFTDFHKDVQKKDGLRLYCKKCRNARQLEIKKARLMGREIVLKRISKNK